MREDFYKLILVTHRQQMPLPDYLRFVEVCAMSGVTSVQLREKEASSEFLFEFGRHLKTLLDPLNVPLVINDNVDLALRLQASGVHLGQTDGCPLMARERLGHDKIIGVSLDCEEDLERANTLPLTYVAAGSVFETKNKSNIRRVWGLEDLQALSRHSKYPLVGIGGIDQGNAASVLHAGAQGIAVVGAIHDAIDPEARTQELRTIIDTFEKETPHAEQN